MKSLFGSVYGVPRHPEDPDELPATYAWRQLVASICDGPTDHINPETGKPWNRSALAKAADTSPGHILKLLNGTTKSSPLVRRINEILGISFLEPRPLPADRAEVMEMMMEVEDLEFIRQAIALSLAGKKP